MKLRNYQNAASLAVFKEWESVTSTLVVMPTGTGKTILFADIIQEMQPRRAMVLAHRSELIWQARDKIQRVTGLRVDVEMGEYKSRVDKDFFHPDAQVIVSTIQTHTAGGDGGGRMTKFNPDDFGLLIIDEAHHGLSDSYRRTIDYYRRNPNLKILGVTATPDRGDEEALGQIFETVAFDYEILDAIKDGWLVPIEQQMVTVSGLDFSSIKTVAGDLSGSELAAVMESEKNLHGVASSSIEIIGSKRGIGFASSVNHAEILSNIFNRHRAGFSACISAQTNMDERKKIISDFSAGRIQFLWNCAVFTEGFDDSGVEIIVMARPTKSRALYAQMAGRATRPHESIAHKLNDCPVNAMRRSMIARSCKPSCLIIDFVGNSGKHKLMTTADILGGNVSDEIVEAAIASAKKSGGRVRMDKSIEDEEKRAEERKQKELEEQARKAKLVVKSKFSSQKVDPFDVFDIKPAKPRGWDEGKQLSSKMQNVLRKAGFNPDELDYAKAKQLVGVLIDRWDKHLCSIKQAAVLKKFNFDPNVTFEVAKATIDKIAASGWKLRGSGKPTIKMPTRKTSGGIIDPQEPF